MARWMNARPPCQFLLFVVVIIASNSPGNRTSRCADGRTALSITIARVVANRGASRSANGCAGQSRTCAQSRYGGGNGHREYRFHGFHGKSPE
jgi:hypothetical protein